MMVPQVVSGKLYALKTDVLNYPPIFPYGYFYVIGTTNFCYMTELQTFDFVYTKRPF